MRRRGHCIHLTSDPDCRVEGVQRAEVWRCCKCEKLNDEAHHFTEWCEGSDPKEENPCQP